MQIKNSFLFLLLATALSGFSQVNALEIKPEKEKMYSPYMLHRHSGIDGLAEFKKNKPHDYLKELWYYSESFYVKRNYLSKGYVLNESIIDISRFESARKENEEAIVIVPGFKDVLVLLPSNQLIYKP